jgi:hypothetical protein
MRDEGHIQASMLPHLESAFSQEEIRRLIEFLLDSAIAGFTCLVDFSINGLHYS